MSIDPRVLNFLEDMVEYAEHISAFTAGVDHSSFEADFEKQLAVIRAQHSYVQQ